MKRSNTILSVGLFVLSLSCSLARAETPKEADFVAARTLGGQVGDWIADMKDKPESIAVFYVAANAPLTPEFIPIVETEIIHGIGEAGIGKVVNCTQCRVPMVHVEKDRLVLTKASPDLETFKAISTRVNVDAFLIVEIHRTRLNLKAQAVLYKSSTANILGAETFNIPALDFTDNSVQLLITFGTGMVLGGTSSGVYPVAANLSLFEEIGFAKAGLNLGAIMATGLGTSIYINPTIAFRGHFGRSGFGYAFTLGGGYGFVGSVKGISARAALELYFGSLAVLGFEASYLYSPSGASPIPGYAGIHAGIAFGR